MEADVQCPICGADTRVCSRPSAHRSLAQRLMDKLYHQRTCQGCCFSFTRLIWAERVHLLMRPYLPQDEHRKPDARRFEPAVTHIPKAPMVQVSRSRGRANELRVHRDVINSFQSAAGPQIPFSIDPVSRTVGIKLECLMGNGEFSGEILAAASSLEQHLRLAADQIRALVDGGMSSPVRELDRPSADSETAPAVSVSQNTRS